MPHPGPETVTADTRLRWTDSLASRHGLAALALFLCVLGLGEGFIELDRERQAQARRAAVTAQVSDLRARLETELNSTLLLTSGLAAYAGASATALDERTVMRLLQAIHAHGRNVRNVVLAPDNRVRFVYPLKGNEAVVGLYYPDVPKQWPAVQRAMRERRTVVAGPLRLVQGGNGLVARSPIFDAAGEYRGILSMVVDWDALARTIGLDRVPPELALAMRGRDASGPAGPVFHGDATVFDHDAVRLALEIPGGTWLIAAHPAGGWTTPHRMLWPLHVLALAAALLVAAPLFAALHANARRSQASAALAALNASLEARVAERTEALSRANAELSAAVETLRSTEHSLIESTRLAALGAQADRAAHDVGHWLHNCRLSADTVSARVDALLHPHTPLRRTEWHAALADLNDAAQAITRNLTRASDRLQSFQQVAVDQTGGLRRRFSLAANLEDLVSTLRPGLRATLSLDLQVHADAELDSFPGALDHALMNLIQNAATHAYPQGTAGSIRVEASRLQDGVEIRVADDGPGIAPDVLPRIFERYFTTRAGLGGTGLGLHIVRDIVTAALGGTIEVDSAPGRGTCFRITLPVRAPQAAGAA